MRASAWNRTSMTVWLSALCLLVACGGRRGDLVRFRGQSFDQSDVRRVASLVPPDLETASEAIDWIVGQLVFEALINEEVLDEHVRAAVLKTAQRVLLQKCITGQLGVRHAGIDIEAEIRGIYDKDPASFDAPERVELQMIFIPVERPDSLRTAREILDASRAPDADFGGLAWRYSSSESASRGGLTGSLKVEELAPEIRAAIRSHSSADDPFLLSGPRGHYIIVVLNYFPALELTFETARAQVLQELTQLLEDRLLKDFENEADSFPVAELDERVFRRPIVEPDEAVFRLASSDITLAEVSSGWEPDIAVSGPQAYELVQTYLRDQRLAAALGCRDDIVDQDVAVIRQVRLEKALVRAVSDVTPEAVLEFLELHRHILLHEASYVLDLAVFPWGDDSPGVTFDRSRGIMDRLANGDVSAEEMRAAGADFFPGIMMTEAQAIGYDPDLASALRSMSPDIYSQPASSDRARGFLMVRLREQKKGEPLDPDNPSDRDEIARIYLQREGDRAVSKVLEALKPEIRARRGAIGDLITLTGSALP